MDWVEDSDGVIVVDALVFELVLVRGAGAGSSDAGRFVGEGTGAIRLIPTLEGARTRIYWIRVYPFVAVRLGGLCTARSQDQISCTGYKRNTRNYYIR